MKGEGGHFPGALNVFYERALPERATPVGYAALIESYDLRVPLPRTFCAVGELHRSPKEAGGWRIFSPRYSPAATLEGHLTFALKHEGLDLVLLKRLFSATGPEAIADLVRAKPNGGYARRLWFLYEWLTGERLDLPDARKGQGAHVAVLDPKQQWAIDGVPSSRHRVRNNLPGSPGFCPLVFRTKVLEDFVAMDLASRARDVVAAVPRDLLARTAAFLLLEDSKSSYAIEGERPPQDRIQRWGRAIGEAGRRAIDTEELLRLQRMVIGDARFVPLGLRREGGFIGEHDRDTRMPLPEHISARAADLQSLVAAMVEFDRGPALKLDAVIAAAVLAFGFVNVHPFADGNGRIHRYLIHHVLAQRGYNPAGVVFPVSAAILERIVEYREVLRDYSQRLLPVIEWEPTPDGNVNVLSDTADFYRFFDATPYAEFLYGCVRKTIEEDLPRETDFLRRYDLFRARIEAIIEMPAGTIDLLFRFLHQNAGQLSKRAREGEFKALTDLEVKSVEDAYGNAFGNG